MSSLRTAIVYENLSKNTHLRKDTAFLHFRLKESSENMIFPWNENTRKLTKIWSFLLFSQIFVKQLFFHSVMIIDTDVEKSLILSNVLKMAYTALE